jgi:histidinol dehydrogenase
MQRITGFEKAKNALDRRKQGINYTSGNFVHVDRPVKDIINEVFEKGDIALFSYTEKFDKVKLDSLKITDDEIKAAYKNVNKKLISELKIAAERISTFHTLCKKQIGMKFEQSGLGRITRPLKRVGIYVPGGTAAYPSTVLMTAVPAKVAGVEEIIMVSPPQKDRSLPSATLVAADIAGVNTIYKIGGAQAIAALACGTDTIPKVDKICGPGNIYVATAKKMVYGIVDIDGIQGPSEVIVVADSSAKPSYCAADLIAQSEHDEMASAILLTNSEKIADAVEKEIEIQLAKLNRKDIITKALNDYGVIAVIENMEEIINLINIFAPEHLLLMVKNAKKYLPSIINAGCIFIGENSPVALGDYIAGPSHVLPTGGTAVFTSPLSIESFLKTTNYVAFNKAQRNYLGPYVIDMAKEEGLDAHANAIKIRLTENK